MAYEITVRRLSKADGGGYLAEVPQLPGCMSDGPAPLDAMENVKEAILSWLAVAAKLERAREKEQMSRKSIAKAARKLAMESIAAARTAMRGNDASSAAMLVDNASRLAELADSQSR